MDFCRRAINEFAAVRNLDIQLCEVAPAKESSTPIVVLPPPNEQNKNESGVNFQFYCSNHDCHSSDEPPSKRRRYEIVDGTTNVCNESDSNGNTREASQALLVVCQFPRQQGKMDTKKLDELKVSWLKNSVAFQTCFDGNIQIPRGPWLSKLKSGQSVKLTDGREVSSE